MERKVLRVEGMSCGHCEMSVREALEELDGVEDAAADHVSGRVELTYEPGKVADGDLRGAVEEAGYALRL